jgi:hypothetical protein
VQALDESQGFKVTGPDLGMPAGASGLHGLGFRRIHHKSNLVLRNAAPINPARSLDEFTR